MNTSFVNITFCYYFSSEEVLQGLTKNNPTKKQIDAEIQATLKHAPVRKRTEEKTTTNYKTKVQINITSI